jgi:hypothetical protein
MLSPWRGGFSYIITSRFPGTPLISTSDFGDSLNGKELLSRLKDPSSFFSKISLGTFGSPSSQLEHEIATGRPFYVYSSFFEIFGLLRLSPGFTLPLCWRLLCLLSLDMRGTCNVIDLRILSRSCLTEKTWDC